MTRSRVRRIGPIVAAGMVTLVLVVVVVGWIAIGFILACGTIVAAAAPLIARVRAGTFDVLEPIVGGSIVLGVIFGVRPIAMLVTDQLTYRDADIRPEFPFVVGLGLIGTLAFTWAYDWVLGHRSGRSVAAEAIGQRLEPALIYGYIAILAALSVLLFGLHISRLGSDFIDGLRLFAGGTSPELINRWAGTTEYLSSSPVLASCAATLLGIATGWRMSRTQLAVMVALIAYPLIVFYVSGDRRFMIPAIGVPLVAWMLMTGRRPSRRLLLIGVPLAFAVLTAIPFVRWGAAQEGSGGFAAAFVQGVGNPVRAVDRFILGPDTSMFSALAIEVRVLRGPSDFFYGRATVGDLILAPIPHLLIPGKPQTARDELLTRAYGAPCQVSAGGVCDDFSIIGTGYQDFWLPGVIGLLAAIAAASAALWSRWSRSTGDPRLVVVLAAWIMFVPIIFRAGFMPATAWSLYFLAPCVIGVLISMRQVRVSTALLDHPSPP